MNKIEKLFNAVEAKITKSEQAGMASESLSSQIFGVFSSQYKQWIDHGFGSNFVQFFNESNILSDHADGNNKGGKKAI